MKKTDSVILNSISGKDKVISFVWQHLWLLISLFIMTFGVALSVRSALGSSVISTIPFVMSLAGTDGMVPALTIGDYTYIMNFLLVGGQMLVLRRRFEPVQLFQLLIGFFFGFLLDVNMALTEALDCTSLPARTLAQLAGCTVLAFGIAIEVRCGSVTMPGEGFPVALSRVTSMPFAKAKIIVDISLVCIAIILGFVFFGRWLWQVVGPGTLFAMVYVGVAVKFISARIWWFDRLLSYHPGFRRYLYGLARFRPRH